jgi:hypothetical protein
MPRGQNRRGKHKFTQEQYARKYKTTRDIMGRYMRAGLDPDDEDAVSLYLRTRTRLKGGHRDLGEEISSKSEVTSPESGTEPEEISSKTALGIAAALEAFKEHEGALRQRVKRALASDDLQALRQWQELWVSSYQEMYKAEKSLIDVKRKEFVHEVERGKMASLADVEIVMTRMCSAIRYAMDSAPDRVAHKLVGMQVPEILEELRKENVVILRELRRPLNAIAATTTI